VRVAAPVRGNYLVSICASQSRAEGRRVLGIVVHARAPGYF
jgi:hypothetical protein